ncbi:MAG: hypothetical protein KDD56_10785 [Bdellovibrionales bacterium]|nr:hypothetical protein [Bdellovibrionales bacterium]
MSNDNQSDKTDSIMSNTVSSLGNTVDAFANKLQRKLSNKQELLEEIERKKQYCGQLLLQAMSAIRKALQETSKINLGARFEFLLDVEDRDGWPKLSLVLHDTEYPDEKDHVFFASAIAREENYFVLFHTGSEKNLGRVDIKEDSDLELVPRVLKNAVRTFLDTTADYVLNPKQAEDKFEPVDIIDQEAEEKNTDTVNLQAENVFVDDDISSDANKVSLADDFDPLDL